VELTELFIEGLVPLNSLSDDIIRSTKHAADHRRAIKKTYSFATKCA